MSDYRERNVAPLLRVPIGKTKSMADREADREAELAGRELAERMSDPGGIPEIPPLLEDRRVKFGIPDEAFGECAAFDRVYVWQIGNRWDDDKDSNKPATYGDTSIVMPDAMHDASVKMSSRGVLVSAGLIALDRLRSHGVGLGHVVHFIRMAPYMRHIGFVRGKPLYLVVLFSNDICSSEDVRTDIVEKRAVIHYDEIGGQHRINGRVRESEGA